MTEQPEGDKDDRDLRVGQLALARGFIKPEQLKQALAQQAREAAGPKKQARALGNILVRAGFLTDLQLTELLEDRNLATAAPGRKAPAIKSVGKYQIVRELGHGGMGVVYEALDTQLHRTVALKLMIGSPNLDDTEASQEEERFVREAQLSANLPRHPNIVGVYEASSFEGRRYIAMEYIEGQGLKEWRKKGSVTLRQQISLLRDVVMAVDHAHRHGVIHRDLKPQNILVNGKNQPYVMDFGLAKTAGKNVALSLTASGMIVGTPAYMSPEQAKGLKTIDRRTDIYSLGIMLYEILTGRTPFRGETPIEILMKVVNDAPPPPSGVVRGGANPTLDSAIENICLKAIAKDPAGRYPSAKAFGEDLTAWLKGEPVRIASQRKSLPRKPLIAAAAGAAALLILIIALSTGGSRSKEAARDRAEQYSKEALESRKRVEALERELAARKKPEPAVAKPAPAPSKESGRGLPPEQDWARSVDLLPLIDLQATLTRGDWSFNNKSLVCSSQAPALLEIPYEPPEEYAFRIEFMRESGNDAVFQNCSREGRGFEWHMGSFKNTTFGFSNLRQQAVNLNPSKREVTSCLVTGRIHVSTVVVRRSGVEAYLDGALITKWEGPASDFDRDVNFRSLRGDRIGLGAWNSPTVFRRARLLELKGKGRVAPPPPSLPPAARRIPQASTASIWGLDFDPSGKWLVSSGFAHNLRIWDVKTGKEHRFFTTGTHTFKIRFSPDGQWLVGGTHTGTVAIRNSENGSLSRTLKGPVKPVNVLGFSRDARTLAAGFDNGEILLWDFAAGTERRRLITPGNIISVGFSADDASLVTAGHGRPMSQWDLASGRELSPFPEHEGHMFAFGPDRKTLATGNWSGRMILRDSASRKELWRNEAPDGDVWAMAFSPAGTALASVNGKGQIRIRDAKTGAFLRLLEGHSAAIKALAFSPDGRTLASAGDDLSIILWDMSEWAALR